jgi:hypothetical protein
VLTPPPLLARSIPPIKIIGDAEYKDAPRLVKMQAKQAVLNDVVKKFDVWFLEHGGGEMGEEVALELAGKKMLLMGLCHFGRLIMTPTADGKKSYKACSV